MNIRRAVTNGLVGLVLFGLYVASYSGLQHRRRSLPDAGESSSGIWNLSPVIIAAIAGEFKGLMADYLTLEAGARLGAKVTVLRVTVGGWSPRRTSVRTSKFTASSAANGRAARI